MFCYLKQTKILLCFLMSNKPRFYHVFSSQTNQHSTIISHVKQTNILECFLRCQPKQHSAMFPMCQTIKQFNSVRFSQCQIAKCHQLPLLLKNSILSSLIGKKIILWRKSNYVSHVGIWTWLGLVGVLGKGIKNTKP